MPSDGRHGPRRAAGEDLDYEKLGEPIDEIKIRVGVSVQSPGCVHTALII